MEQILLAYGLSKENVIAIMILYESTKAMVRSPDSDTDFFNILKGVLHWDTFALYLFIICVDYVLWMLIDLIKENGFTLKKKDTKQTISRRNYDIEDYSGERKTCWMFSYVFKVNINSLTFDQGCQTKKKKKKKYQSHYFLSRPHKKAFNNLSLSPPHHNK